VYVKVNWAHSAEELRALYQAELDAKLRQRYHALWLVRQQHHTIDEIAAVLGVHRSTIIQWIAWYRQGGVEELQAHRVGRAGGVVARLTWDDYDLLAAYAIDGAFRSIEDVRQFVAEAFGVPYSYGGIRRLLARLHLVSVMPRPVSPKADPERQEAWKKGA
jgi:transposase